jgi:predicted PurR-regulated permease PerM
MMHRPPSSTQAGPAGRPRQRSPSKATVPWSTRLTWSLTFLCVGGALFWVLWPVLSVLFASAGLAYLLDPVVDRLEKRGWKRESAIALLFIGGVVFLLLVLLAIVPSMMSQLSALSGNARKYIDNLAKLIYPAAIFLEQHTGFELPLDMATLKADVPEWLKGLSPNTKLSIKELVSGLFTSGIGFFTSIINLALMPVFTFYLLRDWDRLRDFVAKLIPLQYRPRVHRLALKVDERLAAFVRGQITVCCCLAIIYSVGLWLSDIDMAFTIGILAGALFIVPYLGTVVGIVFASTLSIMKFGIDIHLVYVALSFGIAQAIESWILTPTIVGDKVGLHPLVVMIALLVGASLGGIWGMFLAIPLTAVLNVLGQEWLDIYRSSQVFREQI